MNQIVITLPNKRVTTALATFCKRVTFDDAYRRADGETEEERKAMAYRILEALSDVRGCLEGAGYYPDQSEARRLRAEIAKRR
jgi:hypothetical protein